MVVGTPRYMAPEQVTGEGLDARSDLFAVGAILFEMLAGRPAFGGRNAVEILHATLHEQPPALTGSPAVAAADRVIRRALAKRPSDRPASADAMAEELRAVRGMEGDDTPALARALTRLVVLPFRILRPDPETDFLAFSLPDAIATSLSRIGSLVVRSSATAARFARRRAGPQGPRRRGRRRPGGDGNAPALRRPAAGHRAARRGSRAGRCSRRTRCSRRWATCSACRTTSPGAWWRRSRCRSAAREDSPTPQSAAQRPRLLPSISARTSWLAPTTQLPQARDLYQQCLELDPSFAPAWAQLGRCHRVIGKFIDDSADSAALAEEAFRRALELNPRLSLAHKFYAHLEAETGQPRAALVRLLGEADRHGNDPELFAGLVHACRYCGLFEQSIAAHEEARRLDPNVPTSVEQTVMMTGDIERLLAIERRPRPAGGATR